MAHHQPPGGSGRTGGIRPAADPGRYPAAARAFARQRSRRGAVRDMGGRPRSPRRAPYRGPPACATSSPVQREAGPNGRTGSTGKRARSGGPGAIGGRSRTRKSNDLAPGQDAEEVEDQPACPRVRVDRFLQTPETRCPGCEATPPLHQILGRAPQAVERQTTSVSPARKRSRASRRAGRSPAPMAVSSKMRSQPSAGVSLQVERWSSIETRAQPIGNMRPDRSENVSNHTMISGQGFRIQGVDPPGSGESRAEGADDRPPILRLVHVSEPNCPNARRCCFPPSFDSSPRVFFGLFRCLTSGDAGLARAPGQLVFPSFFIGTEGLFPALVHARRIRCGGTKRRVPDCSPIRHVVLDVCCCRPV